MKSFQYYVPQHLIFGRGALNRLETMKLPGKKALIVTMKDRLYVDRVEALLRQNGTDYAVFDGVRANPNTDNINECARFGVTENCDFVIAIGGGSPVDAGQCAALLMYEGPFDNDIWDYVQYFEGHKKAKGCLPFIAISTTAGTGSEVVPGGVLSNDATNQKLDVFDPLMYPVFSIMDPELHDSMPPEITAITGMDAVFHSVEGYLSIDHNPYSDMLYLEAVRYAHEWLVKAYRDPNNKDARDGMAIATNLAGMGESLVDVISLHAMSHTLGSFHHDIPHAVALCLLAPETLSFYCSYPEETRRRMAILAETVGVGNTPEDFVNYMIQLQKDLDLYDIDYTQYGVDEARCAEYACHTVEKISAYMKKDEHTLTIGEVEELFRKALARNRKY